MLLLALDTTSQPGSVALLDDINVVEVASDPISVTHAQRLPGLIRDLLMRRGLESAQIGAYAVAAGPGSFTGLRIGIATIQGLALAHGRLVVPVSALEAMAVAARQESARIVGRADLAIKDPLAIWTDAQRGEVYSAIFDEMDGNQTERVPAAVGTPEQTVERWKAEGVDRFGGLWFAGDGAARYVTIVQEAFGDVFIFKDVVPLAPYIGRLAVVRAHRGDGVRPHAIRPLYVREPDAILARGQRVQ